MEKTSDDLNGLYLAVGYVVVTWALMEQVLDACIAVIFHNYGGRKIQKRIRSVLSKKIDFLKKSFEELPALETSLANGLSIAERVHKLSEQRHNIVHGAINNLAAVEGKFHFRKLKATPEIHKMENVVFDVKNFPKLTQQISELTSDSISLVNELLGKVDNSA